MILNLKDVKTKGWSFPPIFSILKAEVHIKMYRVTESESVQFFFFSQNTHSCFLKRKKSRAAIDFSLKGSYLLLGLPHLWHCIADHSFPRPLLNISGIWKIKVIRNMLMLLLRYKLVYLLFHIGANCILNKNQHANKDAHRFLLLTVLIWISEYVFSPRRGI